MTRDAPGFRRPVTVHDHVVAARCSRGRVVLIDDDPQILASLSALLQLKGLQEECYPKAEDFLAEQASHRPAYPGPVCVVSDVRMADVDGIELLRRLRARPEVPLVLMSGRSGIQEAVDAFRLGTVDFLLKPFEADAFIAAVHKALALSAAVQRERERQQGVRQRLAALTPREHAVALEVVQGRMNREIGVRLGISERMVKMHRHSLMRKLHVDSVAALVRLVDEATATGAASEADGPL